MRKELLTLLAIVGTFSFAFAQSLQVESYDEVVEINSSSINDYSAHVKIKNISGTAVTVNCKRIEFGTPANWCAFDSNYFCWDLCYGNATNWSLGGWEILPGAVDNYFSGHAYSTGNGTTCTDSVRYTFFLANNAADSVSVVLKFSAGPVFGVKENSLQSSKAYPNPAKNYFFVELAKQPKPNTTIEIYNLLGSKVRSIAVRSNKVEINVSDLKSGIYLYTISENGHSIETKKLVVKN